MKDNGGLFFNGHLKFFEDKLWQDSPMKRNQQIKPLYIERCRGIRLKAESQPHDYWEFSVHVNGTGKLISDQSHEITPDKTFLIPPGVSHKEFSRQELDSIWIGFTAKLSGITPKQILSVTSTELTQQFIDCWKFSIKNSHAKCGPELDGRLISLIGMFFRKLHHSPGAAIMQRAINYLNNHYHEIISLPEVAERLNISEGHFYRSFKEFTGSTPTEYLNQIRMKQASVYLCNSNFTIKKITELCGFSDQYYFSRVFRKYSGLSPKHYRERVNRSK